MSTLVFRIIFLKKCPCFLSFSRLPSLVVYVIFLDLFLLYSASENTHTHESILFDFSVRVTFLCFTPFLSCLACLVSFTILLSNIDRFSEIVGSSPFICYNIHAHDDNAIDKHILKVFTSKHISKIQMI